MTHITIDGYPVTLSFSAQGKEETDAILSAVQRALVGDNLAADKLAFFLALEDN